MATAALSKRALADQFAEKTATLDALLNKGDDMTVDDVNSAKALTEEVRGIKATLESFNTAGDYTKDLASFKSFMATPAPRAPQPDGTKVDVLGSTKAGFVEIDTREGKVRLDNGPGHFGQKAWDAITEPTYAKAFWDHVRFGDKGATKDLQLGLDEQAGFLAPADFIARIIGRLPAETQVLGRVTRFTSGRDKVVLPRVQYSTDDIYTTSIRATKTGELPASSTAANITDTSMFGLFKVDVDTWMLRAVVTNDMLEDSAFPLETWLADKFRETIDLLYEDQILNGNGVSAPDGILNNVGGTYKPEVVLSGTSGALDYNGLVDCDTALAPQYDMSACWVMSKKGGLRALRKIKDSNQRPLFATGTTADGMALARPKDLMGYPIVLSQFMSQTVSSSTYPVLFGDLRGQYHVDRIGFTIQVLRELYAETNRLVLLGRVRFGGGTAEWWRMKLAKSHNA